MSSSMQPWIEAEVRHELEAACIWLHSGYRPGQLLREGPYEYQQDRLAVRVKKARAVQVIELHNSRHSPFDATVSDGEVCVRASFDRKCKDAFEKKYLKTFTEGILGTLVAITDFYLICNFESRQSKPLTLDVLAFRLLTSQREATFGQPEGVETKVSTDIFTFTTQLGDIASETHPDAPSPVKSQVGDLADREPLSQSSGRSQEEFSTQVHHFPNYQNTSKIKIEHKDDRPQKGSHLMSLLNSKREDPADRSADTSASTNVREFFRKPTMPKPASPEHIAAMSSRLEAKANLISSPSQTVQPQRSLNAMSQSKKWKEEEHSLEPSQPELSEDSEKENSQELSLGRSQTAPTNSASEKTAAKHGEQFSPSQVIQISPGEDSFIGLRRMPRKHVQVPKDQQKLLDRPDSWVTDSRTINPIVPPEVLKATNHFVDRTITAKSEMGNIECRIIALVAEAGEEDSGDESDDSKDSESNIRTPEPSLKSGSMLTSSFKSIRSADDMGDEEKLVASDEESALSGRDIDWSPSPDRGIKFLRQASTRSVSESSRHRRANKSSSQAAAVEGSDVAEAEDDRHATGLPISRSQSEPGFQDTSKRQGIDVGEANPPSSNQTEDDEMELAYPYAIGDSIQESDTGEDSDLPQAIPSTAVLPRPEIVQVERTPYSHQNKLGAPTNTRGAWKISHAHTASGADLSSDPIIPGTFNDDASKIVLSAAEKSSNKHDDGDPKHDPVHQLLPPQTQSSQRTKESSHNPHPDPDSIVLASTIFVTATNSISANGLGNIATSTKVSQKPVSCSESSERNLIGQTPSYRNSDALVQSAKRAIFAVQDDVCEPPKKRHRSTALSEALDTARAELDIGERVRAKRLEFKRTLSLDTQRPHSVGYQIKSSPPSIRGTLLYPPSSPPSQASQSSQMQSTSEQPASRDYAREDHAGRATRFKEVHREISAAESSSDPSTAIVSASSRAKASIQHNDNVETPITETVESGKAIGYEKRRSPDPDNLRPSNNISLFETFKKAYPTFHGNEKTFIKACVYLEYLERARRQPHPSLWDDFIRAFSSDFREHVRSCRDAGEKPMVGIDFYNIEISEPVFRSRVITPENLKDALSLERKGELDRFRRLFYNKDDARLSWRQSLCSEGQESVSAAHTPSKQESLTVQDGLLEATGEDRKPEQESRTVVPKKPFFETFGQLAAASSRAHREASAEVIDVDNLPKKRRSLPWSQGGSPPGSKVDIGKKAPVLGRKRSLPSETRPGSRKSPETWPSQSHLRRSLGSPILGNVDELPSPIGSARTPDSKASSRKDTDLGTRMPSVAASKTTKRQAANSPYSRTDNLNPVQGWLKDQQDPLEVTKTTMQPPHPFARKVQHFLKSTEKYVPRKKRLSGLSSATSTPSSTPALGSSTQEKAAEPETQTWEF